MGVKRCLCTCCMPFRVMLKLLAASPGLGGLVPIAACCIPQAAFTCPAVWAQACHKPSANRSAACMLTPKSIQGSMSDEGSAARLLPHWRRATRRRPGARGRAAAPGAGAARRSRATSRAPCRRQQPHRDVCLLCQKQPASTAATFLKKHILRETSCMSDTRTAVPRWATH